MLTVTVRYVFPPSAVAAAEEHIRGLIPATRAEPGCRAYEVFRAVDTPNAYLFFEQYDDEAALDAHRASPHFAQHGLGGVRLLAESREAALYRAFG
jgi:quinol monooxygenase YgiN